MFGVKEEVGSALPQGRDGKPAERDSISLGRGGKGTERRRRNREVLGLPLVKEGRKRKQSRQSGGRSPTFCQTRRCYSVNLSCWLLCTPVVVMKNTVFTLAAISWNEQHLLCFLFFYDSSSSVMLFIQFSILWNKMYVMCADIRLSWFKS